jgi:hypothetical protein
MSRTVGMVLAFGGGVAVGLLIAKYYARNKVQGGISDLLTSVGVSQGTANGIAQGIAPAVTG